MNDKDLQKLTDLHPCDEALEWYQSQPSMQEAWANCERGDWMIWVLKRKKKLTKKNAVIIAIACASRVLKIYENRNPGNPAPRKAIEAAQAYLDRPCTKTRQEAAAAAAAAYAAYAAYAAAAYAAAYAAAAASYAAYAAAAAAAAADAAYAAYAAAAYAAADAAAAAAYAAAARKSERIEQAKIIRSIYPKFPR